MSKKKKEESPKVYSLYEKPEYDNLLAMAYSEEQVEEESQYYTGGTWYVADLVKDKFIIDEVLYEKEVKFLEKPKERELNDFYNRVNTRWIKNEDLR